MFSHPDKNIEAFGIMPGNRVADLGAGSGFYTIAAGRAVGATGHVYAIDIQKDLLSKIKNLARHEKLLNVEVIWGDVEKVGGTKLRESSIDAVILANILFQIENKENLVKEIFRILKPRGKVMIVDWQDSFGGIGPHSDSVVNEKMANQLFSAPNFDKVKSFNAGSHHYGLILQKK